MEKTMRQMADEGQARYGTRENSFTPKGRTHEAFDAMRRLSSRKGAATKKWMRFVYDGKADSPEAKQALKELNEIDDQIQQLKDGEKKQQS